MQLRSHIFFFWTLLLLAPLTVHGQAPVDAPSRASALIVKGNRAWAAGNLERAERHYDQAWELAPSNTLLYRRAQVAEGRGQLPEAIALYTTFLEREPASPYADAIRRHVIELSLGASPSQVPVPTLFVTTLTVVPSFATVSLDGTVLPARAPYILELTPGDHQLLVSARGYRSSRLVLTGNQDLPAQAEVVLEREAPSEPVLQKREEATEKEVMQEPEVPLMEVDISPPGWATALSWGMVPPGTLLTAIALIGLTQDDPLLNSTLLRLLGPAMLAGSSVMLFVIDWPAKASTPLVSSPTPVGRFGATLRFSF